MPSLDQRCFRLIAATHASRPSTIYPASIIHPKCPSPINPFPPRPPRLVDPVSPRHATELEFHVPSDLLKSNLQPPCVYDIPVIFSIPSFLEQLVQPQCNLAISQSTHRTTSRCSNLEISRLTETMESSAVNTSGDFLDHQVPSFDDRLILPLANSRSTPLSVM